MTLAKELGLYMIVRPGPYINAEANAGGFPLWVTTGAYGALRNNDARYTEAWTPYMTEISKILAPHLITNGGNVILVQVENELGGQWLNTAAKTPNVPVQDYMELLENTVRENGINVPLTQNSPNMVQDRVGLLVAQKLIASRMTSPGQRTSPTQRAMSTLWAWTVTPRAGVAT